MAVNIKAALTRKIGPLPVWAWLGAGAGGIVVGRFVLNRRATAGSGAASPSVGAIGGAAPLTGIDSAVPYDITGRDSDLYESDPYTDPLEPLYPVAPLPGAYEQPDPVPPTPTVVVAPPTTSTGPSQPFATGRCPAGECLHPNGLCRPKVIPAWPCRMQPGASPAGGDGRPRRCQTGYQWNGFTCVPVG